MMERPLIGSSHPLSLLTAPADNAAMTGAAEKQAPI
jgi:hypothetical protein